MSAIFAVESTTARIIVIKVQFLHQPINEDVKLGFQDQEDGTKLGNEQRSVRFWYVSSGGSR